jgi:hypothetical protein
MSVDSSGKCSHWANLLPECPSSYHCQFFSTDRARADLAAYVIKVQHIIITLMTESNTSFILVLPSLPTVYATSEETRLGVVSALAEQHQRMAQAKPLRSSRLLAAFAQLKIARSRRTVSDSTAVSESHSTPESSICEENDLEESKSANTYYGVDDGTFRCRGCGFSGSSQKASDLLIRTCKGNLAGYWFVIKQRELFKCHFNDTKSGRQAEAALYCPICYDGSPKSESVVRYTILQLVAHIKDTHTYDDLETRDLVDEITR